MNIERDKTIFRGQGSPRIGLCIILAVFFLFSCGKKVLIDETKMFENGCWMRFEPAEFKVDIDDIDKNYNIAVTLRYDTSKYTEKSLPLVIDYFADSNELRNFSSSVRLIDKNGRRRGELIGEYCTVCDTIDRYRMYNKAGTYTYRIKQKTSRYELYGITSFGLKIEKAKME